MANLNFKAIGRTPGKCIFAHQDDVPLLKEYGYPAKVKCIRVDLISGEYSEPIIIDRLLKFVPHEIICSEGEREVISDLVKENLSENQIEGLNRMFEKIKYHE